jgi:hypothetical protein
MEMEGMIGGTHYFFLMIGMPREHQVNEKPLLKTVDVVILNGFDS